MENIKKLSLAIVILIFTIFTALYFYMADFVEFQTRMNNNDFPGMQKMVREEGYNVNQTRLGHNHFRLYLTAKHSRTSEDILEKLVRCGYQINNRMPDQGISDLMFATILGDIAAVKFLIKNGADVNYKNPETHLSILDTALRSNKPEIANYLLENTAAKLSAADTKKDYKAAVYYTKSGILSPLILERMHDDTGLKKNKK